MEGPGKYTAPARSRASSELPVQLGGGFARVEGEIGLLPTAGLAHFELELELFGGSRKPTRA